jgi:UDP-N-acetyl-2-amino-2-deoxyglucuronate dehydrogenase
MKNFALIGVAGFVAPRHLQAIRETGNCLLAATDPNDSVGVLDRYSFDVKFFREIERFDRFLEKGRRGPDAGRVDFLSVCSPNYLHDAHVRLGLRVGADVICEKPLVINPWNLDALEELERESGKRIFTLLQLRLHPSLVALRERLAQDRGKRREVALTYITARGPWYHVSWKGSEERSGGLAMNIGIHFFDLLMWLFGPVTRVEVHRRDEQRMTGTLELRDADVRWQLSIDRSDLPASATTTYRSITVDGEEIEFTGGFETLHTDVYRDILGGRGARIADARPSIELVHAIRTAPITGARS